MPPDSPEIYDILPPIESRPAKDAYTCFHTSKLVKKNVEKGKLILFDSFVSLVNHLSDELELYAKVELRIKHARNK